MKHLNEEWRDLLGKVQREKRDLEEYIQTPKGAREAVEWLAVMFVFCALNAAWASWNLWHILLSVIW